MRLLGGLIAPEKTRTCGKQHGDSLRLGLAPSAHSERSARARRGWPEMLDKKAAGEKEQHQ